MEFLVSLAVTIFLSYIVYTFTKKRRPTKSNYFILIDNWKVKDGDFVTSGQQLATVTLCIESSTTKKDIRFMPRILRADKSRYLKKVLKGSRLYVKEKKNIDDISFDLDDIMTIEK